MHLDVTDAALLGLLTSALHWLVGRSVIARPLWSRARGLLAALLRCPACCGWWLGLGLGALGLRPVDTLLGPIGDTVAAGLLSLWATPVLEGVLVWGLEVSAVPHDVSSPEGPSA